MIIKRAIVIGAGFGGLSAGTILAQRGYEVTVIEKNGSPGGRCRQWETSGYKFDMGPSWYLMPDVFEHYFSVLGESINDYYSIKRLDPNYRLFFDNREPIDIPADIEGIYEIFDSMEENGASKLKQFLNIAKFQYDTAMERFMYRDYNSIRNIMDMNLAVQGLKLHIFESVDKFVSRYFSNEDLRKILEYTMVFLGGSPNNTPALYSIMSHVDFDLGVWYPKGGMYKLSTAFRDLAEKKGVKFMFNTPVRSINIEKNRAVSVSTPDSEIEADIIISNADYHHTEMDLLPEQYRTYKDKYWNKKVMGPSSFLMYLGIDREIDNLKHHNLYLSGSWDRHFSDIFDNPQWPGDPSYYVSVISKTDSNTAPEGKENVFVLVPVASGLKDTEEIRDKYSQKTLDHLSGLCGFNIRNHIDVKRTFAHNDFKNDYNAYKGTALGMSHTLMQTAIFRCSNQSKKVKNLFYSGSYTHPGIGIPMVIISGEVIADKISRLYD
ncbi:MAG: phytoene desaturase family protein [bacterium]